MDLGGKLVLQKPTTVPDLLISYKMIIFFIQMRASETINLLLLNIISVQMLTEDVFLVTLVTEL
jgi:hypothetical protein